MENEIPIKIASTSTSLKDLVPELGIESPRKYISDEISSWFIELNFPDVYCVEKILSMLENAENHRWECSEEDACGVIPCMGPSCSNIEVSVLKENDADTPENCGNSLKMMIPEADDKLLNFDYSDLREIVVIGYLLEMDPTPTTTVALEPENLVAKCPNLGENDKKLSTSNAKFVSNLINSKLIKAY